MSTYYFSRCGCIPLRGLRDHYPLVKSTCHYDVVDVYTVTELVQNYESRATVNCDVDYVFPLPPNAAVCAFKAVIDGKKVIKGIVKEKQEAKREYREAVAQGKTAGLLEKEHADIFRVSLGNIKPNQAIAVHITFVSIIEHDGSTPDALRLTIPTTIAPRYGVAPTLLYGTNAGSRMELTVAVKMNNAVTSVSSPTHPISLTLGCAAPVLTGDFNPSRAFVTLSDAAFLDKDIMVVISSQKLDHPRCTVERRVAISDNGAKETTDAFALTLVPKFDLPPLPIQEYLFLVDRSGSMAGFRIAAVKAALQIMLRSLPSKNSSFNIISFGSRCSFLWPKSQLYCSETVEKASRHVDSLSANMSGTEIRNALSTAFKTKTTDMYEGSPISTAVFVLTDGEAWDLDNVINTVNTEVTKSKEAGQLLRTFVLGVGNSVSVPMCEGIARAGNGISVFVTDQEKPDVKLMTLLRAARGGVIDDLTVDWGVENNDLVKESGVKDPADDFEIVSNCSGEPPSGPVAPLPSPPPVAPISLFDASLSLGPAPELGPQKVIVNLSPPPRIQQAPKSDKLPIPLYPGFRCSIFAIVKLDEENEEQDFQSAVRIKGNIKGHPVELEVPVMAQSAADASAKTTLNDSSGRVDLLHTLAARALVQHFEDQPTSPEIMAQIERIGKKYSLATSVTSFLAIDQENNQEILPTEEEDSGTPLPDSGPTMIERPTILPTHAYPHQKARGSAKRKSMDCSDESTVPIATEFDDGIVSRSRTKNSYRRSSTGRGITQIALGSQLTGALEQQQPQQRQQQLSMDSYAARELDSNYTANVSFYSALSPFSSSQPPPLFGNSEISQTSSSPYDIGNRKSKQSLHVARKRRGSTQKETGEVTSLPLTLEVIARAQLFDGSFPTTQPFISQLLSGDGNIPNVPPALNALTGLQDVKSNVWITVITLEVLAKQFPGEKVVWEMMEEKAKEYLVKALNELGVSTLALANQFIGQLRGESKRVIKHLEEQKMDTAM